MNSVPKTVTRQRSSCDLNPGPSAPESSMLTTHLVRYCLISVCACALKGTQQMAAIMKNNSNTDPAACQRLLEHVSSLEHFHISVQHTQIANFG